MVIKLCLSCIIKRKNLNRHEKTLKQNEKHVPPLPQALGSTIGDRVAVNHCVTEELCGVFGKQLYELNCNLHPLDGVSLAARKALSAHDKVTKITSSIYGFECKAANLVRAVSKLRYKAKSGDPTGFVTFLKSKDLPVGIILRYVGNRIHVLFQMSGTIVHILSHLVTFLSKFSVAKKLSSAVLKDLSNEAILVQLQVLGLLGKVLTGPWMVLFYSNQKKASNLETNEQLKKAVQSLKDISRNPQSLLTCSVDSFGNELTIDEKLQSLRSVSYPGFDTVAKQVAEAMTTTLERQLSRYLTGDLSCPSMDMLSVCKSAPLNNFHAERVLGRFCSQCVRAPNATTGFLEAKTKAGANKTLEWLVKQEDDKQEELVKFARSEGARAKTVLKVRQERFQREKLKRQFETAKKKERSERNKIEKKVKELIAKEDINGLVNDVKEEMRVFAKDVANRNEDAIGVRFRHLWDTEGEEDVEFIGVVSEFKIVRKMPKISVKYVADRCDPHFEILHIYQFLADLIMGDIYEDYTSQVTQSQ